jgi:hypothetical protein
MTLLLGRTGRQHRASGFQMVFDYYGLVAISGYTPRPCPDDAAMADTMAVVTTPGQNAVASPTLSVLAAQVMKACQRAILGQLGVSGPRGRFQRRGPALPRGARRAWRSPGHLARPGPAQLPLCPAATGRLRAPGAPARGHQLFEQKIRTASLRQPEAPGPPGKEFPAVFVGASGGFAAEDHIY